MNAIDNLSEIRGLECSMLSAYRDMSIADELKASSMLGVSIDVVRMLKNTPETMSENLERSFRANTSTMFKVSPGEMKLKEFSTMSDEVECPIEKRIRALERKIILELRDICLKAPSVAAGCCGLSKTQIDSIGSLSPSKVIEFCFSEKEPVLELRFRGDKNISSMLAVASKPCFTKFALLIDRMTK